MEKSKRVSNRSKVEVLYTVAEAAVYLRVSENTIYKWLKEGRIKRAVQVGGKVWRIPATSLWELFKEYDKEQRT